MGELKLSNIATTFPIGTAVGLHTGALDDAGTPAPLGPVIASAVVDAGGNLAFADDDILIDGSTYVAAARIGGSWRVLRHTTSAPSVIQEMIAAAVAAEAELREAGDAVLTAGLGYLTVFYANFATENAYEFTEEQANPGRITSTFVANIGQVAQFEVEAGEPEVAGGHRAELRDGGRYIAGDDLLFAVKLRRLSGDWTHFHIPFQLHDESEGGSPPVCGVFEELAGRRYLWIGPGNKFAKPTETFCRLDITGEEEAWLDLVIGVKVSATDGEVRVWRDGVPQEVVGGGYVKKGLNTLGIGSLYSKIGSYVSQSAVGMAKVQIAWLGVMRRLFA